MPIARDVSNGRGPPDMQPGNGRILVVDDDDTVRTGLARLLSARGYDCEWASDVAEARHALGSHRFALVLCDIQMPHASGLELLRQISDELPGTATVMVTGLDDTEIARQALELGAYGYVVKPFRPNEILINVMNALRRSDLERQARSHVDELESKISERGPALTRAINRLDSIEPGDDLPWQETLDRLGRALALRDEETGRHIERVGLYCALLSQKLGSGTWTDGSIRQASMLHDAGKIGVPDAVLLKPGPLTVDERKAVERHCELGYRLLAGSQSRLLELAATIALTHHERWNGQGYPQGLMGAGIPLEGRITGLADVFDALTSDRVYRTALPLEKATEIITAERAQHFDPDVIDVFLDTIGDFESIRLERPDEPNLERPDIQVLVVDEHRLFAEGLVNLLQSTRGISVVGRTGSVEEAVRLTRAGHPDVLLIDWTLPDGTGADAARAVRAEYPETKVVILTTSVDGTVLAEALAAGCSGVLSKERDLQDAIDAVRAAYDGEVTIPLTKLATVVARLGGEKRRAPTDLTPRELEVLGMLAEGLSNDAIAESLFLSLNTIRNHVQRIITKLGVHSKLEAVTTALRMGLIELRQHTAR